MSLISQIEKQPYTLADAMAWKERHRKVYEIPAKKVSPYPHLDPAIYPKSDAYYFWKQEQHHKKKRDFLMLATQDFQYNGQMANILLDVCTETKVSPMEI